MSPQGDRFQQHTEPRPDFPQACGERPRRPRVINIITVDVWAATTGIQRSDPWHLDQARGAARHLADA
jgi:hypothetical protein